MTMKKDLEALSKDIKTNSRKLDRLLKGIEKSDKIKLTKRVPAKNASSKKKSDTPTATEHVLRIINRSKKGVDTATLMKKTGFNQKKVWNIIQRAFKNGKIRRVGKGLYVGMKAS